MTISPSATYTTPPQPDAALREIIRREIEIMQRTAACLRAGTVGDSLKDPEHWYRRAERLSAALAAAPAAVGEDDGIRQRIVSFLLREAQHCDAMMPASAEVYRRAANMIAAHPAPPPAGLAAPRTTCPWCSTPITSGEHDCGAAPDCYLMAPAKPPPAGPADAWRQLRPMRCDAEIFMRDMAAALQVLVPYLCAVELGKQPMPADWPERYAQVIAKKLAAALERGEGAES